MQQLINNYFSMAKNALQSQNAKEAELYANKIIELDPTNSEAWEIKGDAISLQFERLKEAVSAWINAINFAKKEEKDYLDKHVAKEFCATFKSELYAYTSVFAKTSRSDNSFKSIKTSLDYGIYMMNDLTIRGGVHFDRGTLYNEIAKQLNSCVVDGYKNAKKKFGPEHSNMFKYQWDEFINSCDNCVEILKEALKYVRDADLGSTLCENMVIISEECRDSCSWKFDCTSYTYDNHVVDYSFTDEAKQIRTKNINIYKKWGDFFKVSPYDAVMEIISKDCQEVELEIGKKAYWAEHKSEKQNLENEKRNLQTLIEDLNKEISSLPILSKIREVESKIDSLDIEKNNLGLFKIKQKKALQEQIDEKESELNQLRNTENDQKRPLEYKITQCKKRIIEIDSEFDKNRGAGPTEGLFTIANVMENGEIKVTPEQLVKHLSNNLPVGYQFDELEAFNCSHFHRNFSNCWAVAVERIGEGRTGIMITMQAESKNTPIKSIIVQTSCGRNINGIVLWCKICSRVIMSFYDILPLKAAEQLPAVLMLHDDCSAVFNSLKSLFDYVTYKHELKDKTLDLKSMLIKL